MHVMEKVRSKNRRGRGRENSNTQQKKEEKGESLNGRVKISMVITGNKKTS